MIAPDVRTLRAICAAALLLLSACAGGEEGAGDVADEAGSPAFLPAAPLSLELGAPPETNEVKRLAGGAKRLISETNAIASSTRTALSDVAQARTAYRTAAAELGAGLAEDPPRNDPALVKDWQRAQDAFAAAKQGAEDLDGLAKRAASANGLADSLSRSLSRVRNRQDLSEADTAALDALERDVGEAKAVLPELQAGVEEEAGLARRFVATQGPEISALRVAVAAGRDLGGSLAPLVEGEAAAPPEEGPATHVGAEQPFVVIRFGNPDFTFEEPVVDAVRQALERRPQTGFDIVAVAPEQGGEPASQLSDRREHAERVYLTLVNMGVPGKRLTLAEASSPRLSRDEVHIYVR